MELQALGFGEAANCVIALDRVQIFMTRLHSGTASRLAYNVKNQILKQSSKDMNKNTYDSWVTAANWARKFQWVLLRDGLTFFTTGRVEQIKKDLIY